MFLWTSFPLACCFKYYYKIPTFLVLHCHFCVRNFISCRLLKPKITWFLPKITDRLHQWQIHVFKRHFRRLTTMVITIIYLVESKTIQFGYRKWQQFVSVFKIVIKYTRRCPVENSVVMRMEQMSKRMRGNESG